MSDLRRFAPAVQRNRKPILDVLRRVLPPEGCILETGSGTGEHATYFAKELWPRDFIPSDPDPRMRESIAAWSSHSGTANLHGPLNLDVTKKDWLVESGINLPQPISTILSINMMHIASWSVCLGFLAGAGRILKNEGVLVLYGPFKRIGVEVGQGNKDFDEYLRSQNSGWGIRSLDRVTVEADKEGLTQLEIYEMPSNNLCVIYGRKN